MDKLWLLGVGGSVSLSDPRRACFGGATTCVLLRLDGQYILLDAGTGILQLPPEALAEPTLTLLLSHFHLDHVIGLPMCPYLLRPGGTLHIWAGGHEGRSAREALGELFAPPLWPVGIGQLPADLEFHTFAESFTLGGVRVETLRGCHPNGVYVFRLTGREHSVVFATDCTLTPSLTPVLTDFARDCDLLLCDGQYSPEEWERRSGFGHNTWTAAAALARDCGARAFRVIHHDPGHSDEQLTAAQAQVEAICPAGRMARQGEEILL